MGIFLTDLANILRAEGLTVVEISNWRTRGFKYKDTPDGGLIALRGGLVHHTATSARATGNYPSLNVVWNGRADVAGPLAQLGLGRDGTWYVIAAGRANHSGAVDNPNYHNAYAIGVEAEHPGGSDPWPQVQYDSYVRGCRALGKAYGITWRGHKEAAVPKGRKPDPNFDMDKFRADIAGAPVVVPVDMPVTAPPRPPVAPNGLVVDGSFGPLTKAALQRVLGVAADGIVGPVTVKALQRRLGVTADGIWGPITTRALQRRLGVTVDGIAGPQTYSALQRRLNGGTL